jgi:hypothetical protein
MMDDFSEIRVSWLLDDGTITPPVVHGLALYGGIVPSVEDVILVGSGKDANSAKVVERYVVPDIADTAWWHIVLRHHQLDKGCLAALTCPVKAARLDGVAT